MKFLIPSATREKQFTGVYEDAGMKGLQEVSTQNSWSKQGQLQSSEGQW